MFFDVQVGTPGAAGDRGIVVQGQGPGWQSGVPNGPGADGQIVIVGGEPGQLPPGGPGAPTAVQLPNPNQLSDRLGQALGVSGDRVREAMRQTIGTLPPPVDPLSRIATQLGVSVDRVRDAFSNPECPGQVTIMLRPSSNDLARPAQRLGVPVDRLAAAIAATAPPPPPSFDDTINRIAQNLGVAPERLRAALEQVEGPNRLFIAVPAPAAPPR
jgi:hypothetical protein